MLACVSNCKVVEEIIKNDNFRLKIVYYYNNKFESVHFHVLKYSLVTLMPGSFQSAYCRP